MATAKKWPMDEMISWYQDGLTYDQIADRLGTPEWQPYWISQLGHEWSPTRNTVDAAMKKAGCVARKKLHTWPVYQMIEWYKSGKHTGEIAELLCSEEWQPYWISHDGREFRPHKVTVTNVLKSAGCQIRSASERAIDRHPNKKPWPIETMIALYDEGMSLKELSGMLSSDAWQEYWIDKTGIEYRPDDKIVNKILKKRMALRGRGAPGQRNGFWRGGRHYDTGGYVLVHAPDNPMANANGFVREHRLVASKMIGRPLLPTEAVHHVNEIRDDNRPENLVVFSTHLEHAIFHGSQPRKPAQIFSTYRRAAIRQNKQLSNDRARLVRKWFCDDCLSMNQISVLLDIDRRGISQMMKSLGIYERRRDSGTVTDLIREESRQFLASLDSLARDVQASRENSGHSTT